MHKIIKFSPNRVWRTYQGGKILDQIEGKDLPEDTHFPEDWIGSIVEAKNIGREHISEGLAHILEENSKGDNPKLFKDLVQSNTKQLLGLKQLDDNSLEPRSMDAIPLVKYLDSATRLHFQAHPTREFAQQRLNSPRGKTEAYVILAIREEVANPYIYAGFQRPPTRAQLKQWIESQDIYAIESCFDKIQVKPGDVFLIPGGRPHALGEGILMLEIMEPSDLAVRFEFERCGYLIPEPARFMNRGIETALDAFNFDPVPIDKVSEEFACQAKVVETDGESTLELLIGSKDTSCFTVKRAQVTREFKRQQPSFFIGVVTKGKGQLKIDDDLIELEQWERFFCPADVKEFTYISSSKMEIIECYPGES